jgi:hypothetical protein
MSNLLFVFFVLPKSSINVSIFSDMSALPLSAEVGSHIN